MYRHDDDFDFDDADRAPTLPRYVAFAAAAAGPTVDDDARRSDVLRLAAPHASIDEPAAAARRFLAQGTEGCGDDDDLDDPGVDAQLSLRNTL